MRRIVILTALCLIFTFHLEAEKVKGKIFFGHDTIDVIFNIPVNHIHNKPGFERLQFDVTYYNSRGEKFKLRPDDALEYQFTFNHETFRMISVYNSLGLGEPHPTSDNIFLLLEIDGKLRLFLYFETRVYPDMSNLLIGTPGGINYYRLGKYILQKGEGALKKPDETGFKKDMAAYFSDCPELATKILNKEYDKYDLKPIVDFYNLYCVN